MSGFLSIEKRTATWSKADTNAYLAMGAVGALSGIAVANAQMPLHLPGHKALLWMVPVVASRLLTRARAGASMGSLATVMSTLSLGGRLAGGLIMMPMVIVAGVILDWAAGIVERHNLHRLQGLLLLALAGTAGNLVCLIKRLFEPVGTYFSVANLNDMLWTAGCYAFFGLLAGLLGAAVGYGIMTLKRRFAAMSGKAG